MAMPNACAQTRKTPIQRTTLRMLAAILLLAAATMALAALPAKAHAETIQFENGGTAERWDDGTIHGTCSTVVHFVPGSRDDVDWFDVVMPSGETLRGYCITSGAGAPGNDTYEFVATPKNDGSGRYNVVVQSDDARTVAHESGWIEPQEPGHHSAQFIGNFDWAPPIVEKGGLNLAKHSTNPEMSENSSCYSLKGAKYGIYKTPSAAAGMGEPWFTMTTGVDFPADRSQMVGEPNDDYWETNMTIPKGTYYVKELEASPGFALDTTIYEVTVVPGRSVRVNGDSEDACVKEIPQRDPESVSVGKIDKWINQNKPEGSGSLENAEFTFTHYAGYYTEEQIAAGKPAQDGVQTRTWVLRTNEDGIANVRNGDTQKVSGDEFYRDGSGNIILPLGTLTATETKAPEGYLLGTPKTFVTWFERNDANPYGTSGKRTPQNYIPGETTQYNDPTSDMWQEEFGKRGDIELYKKDADKQDGTAQTGTTLAGAVYEVYNASSNPIASPQYKNADGTPAEIPQGGVVCTIVTDASGYASTTRADLNGWTVPEGWDYALAYGSYAVKEKSASSGYEVNVEWTGTATIESNGQKIRLDTTEKINRGEVEVVKKDADTPDGSAQAGATLAGAVYEIINDSVGPVTSPQYKDPAGAPALIEPGGVVCEIVTDANGFAATDNGAANGWTRPADWPNSLPLGYYTVKEKSASSGYEVNVEWEGYVELVQDKSVVRLDTIERVERGNIALVKSDNEQGSTAQGETTLAGAVYQIVNENPQAVFSPQYRTDIESGGVVCTIVTDENGHASTENEELNGWKIPEKWNGKALPAGNYSIKEETPSNGYHLNTTWEGEVSIVANENDPEAVTTEVVERGDIELVKSDAETSSGNAQGKATLAGAVYNVINKSDEAVYSAQYGRAVNPNDIVCTIVTDENGFASTNNASVNGWAVPEGWDGALPKGRYTVTEATASEGYRINTSWIGEVTIEEADQVIEKTTDETVKRGGVAIGKVDAQNGKYRPQGKATLAGAVFEIISNNDQLVKVNGVEYAKNEVICTIETTLVDGKYMASTAENVIPYGDYILREVQAPEGYLLDNMAKNWRKAVNIREDMTIVDYTDERSAEPENVIRGDIAFSKVHSGSMARLGMLPFLVTSKTTGESHIIVTDKNGMLSSAADWNSHESNTNGNDAALREDGTVDDSKLDPYAGVWFSGTEIEVVPDDSFGALPYDDYTIEELPCEANSELVLVSFEISVERNARELDLGTVDDHPAPSIGTTLTDEMGMHLASTAGVNSIVDTVRYDDFPAGNYTMEGELHKLDTAGNDAGIVATASQPFTASTSSGSVEVHFSFDANEYVGETLVAVERVIDEKGKMIASHVDLTDTWQMMTIPSIGTTLTDGADGDHEASSATTVTLIDEVSYNNLEVGKIYEMAATLHVKDADGNDAGVALDAEGNEIKSVQAFSPETPSGTVDVVFTFNAHELGYELVAFEELVCKDKVYATHADINDRAQTVTIPSIGTTAADALTDDDVAAENNTKIIDTVTYTELTPGDSYTLVAELHGRDANGQDVGVLTKNGAAAVVEKAFTPESKNGSVEVEISADERPVKAIDTVVFETLYRSDDYTRNGEKATPIAKHADISDDGQSIHHALIDTTATNQATGNHSAPSFGTVTILDSVEYENLVPGREYTVAGTLHYRDASGNDGGAVAADSGATSASKTFTALKASGTVVLEFEVSADALAGTTVVAFETLSHNGVAVASHADITDDAQAVTFVSNIGTTARSAATGTHMLELGKSVTVVDTVEYSGLVPGENYIMYAELHVVGSDGADGGVVKTADGGYVDGKTSFTARNQSGTVEVELYKFDTTAYAPGTRFVAFETLCTNQGNVLAEHADINSADQSVTMVEIGTTLVDASTKKHEAAEKKNAKLIDTVKYKGLEPGRKYLVTGELYDKKTGKPLTEKSVVGSTVFTAEKSEGTVDVAFEIKDVELPDKTVVAFEDVYLIENDDDTADKGILVGRHADIDDKEQAVAYKEPTPATEAAKAAGEALDKTGYFLLNYWWVVLIVIGALVGGGAYLRFRRNRW